MLEKPNAIKHHSQFAKSSKFQLLYSLQWFIKEGVQADWENHKTPGQLIEALLDQKAWNKRILSVILGIDETVVNKIVSGRRRVDAGLALTLSDVFNVPAEVFLEIQKAYDLAQAKIVARPDPQRANRAILFGDLPITEMIKRRWLDADDVRDTKAVTQSLLKFFGVSAVDEIEILPHAAKKTQVSAPPTPAQLAWLYRVREIASEILVPPYSVNAARGAVDSLVKLRSSPEAARKVPRILFDAGIRFLIVEALASTKIDGVCFWVNARSPVVGLSLRYDRIDNFWFVLRHEMEHVLRGHGLSKAMLDTELEGDRAGIGASIPEEERVANEAAAEFCVPSRQIERFIAKKSPFFAERDILGFAKTLGVHPGLVAGQLQHRTGRYDLFRKHLVKIRSSISPGTTVDGWGDVAPVGS